MKKFILVMMAAVIMVPAALAQERAKSHKVQIVAHRGYWNCEEGQNAKNSIASLAAAQKHGFWGSEFDVNMTKDGVLLVFHDGSIKIDGEKKRIDQNNYEVFKDYRLVNGEPIPTLADYLVQARKSPKTKMVFEIKKASTPEHERACVDESIKVLKEYGYFSPKKTIFISFSMNVCKYLAEVAPGFTVQYLGSDRTPDQVFAEGVNGVDTEYGKLLGDKDWVSSAKAHGMSVNTWTVDEEDSMEAVLLRGVDQITTNEPEVTRALIKKQGWKEEKKTRR